MATSEDRKYAEMFLAVMRHLAREGRPAAEVYKVAFAELKEHEKMEAGAWMPDIMGEDL